MPGGEHEITSSVELRQGRPYREELVQRLRLLCLSSPSEISRPAVAKEAAYEIERLERACVYFCARLELGELHTESLSIQ